MSSIGRVLSLGRFEASINDAASHFRKELSQKWKYQLPNYSSPFATPPKIPLSLGRRLFDSSIEMRAENDDLQGSGGWSAGAGRSSQAGAACDVKLDAQ